MSAANLPPPNVGRPSLLGQENAMDPTPASPALNELSW